MNEAPPRTLNFSSTSGFRRGFSFRNGIAQLCGLALIAIFLHGIVLLKHPLEGPKLQLKFHRLKQINESTIDKAIVPIFGKGIKRNDEAMSNNLSGISIESERSSNMIVSQTKLPLYPRSEPIPVQEIEESLKINPSTSKQHALNTASFTNKRIKEFTSEPTMNSSILSISQEIQLLFSNPPKDPFPICREVLYDVRNLPKVSIIIPSRNDSWNSIWRTLRSIFQRTSDHLLHEIILLNDYDNDKANITKLLTSAKYYFPSEKLRIYQTLQPEDLIRLKNIGARVATGEVLVFLESHIEVQDNWLEPLLQRIVDSPKSIVLPQHDIIDQNTFKTYLYKSVATGGFNCKLEFIWNQESRIPSNPLDPVLSPTMPGGMFAISRELWMNLGEYDDKMQIWGGENVELSLRAWLCGARLEFIPCSHVCHKFRSEFPYKGPIDSGLENTMRTAIVWSTESFRKKCNYLVDKLLFTKERVSSVQDRMTIHHQLKCKDMDWYLKNIYAEFSYDKFRLSEKEKKDLYNSSMTLRKR